MLMCLAITLMVAIIMIGLLIVTILKIERDYRHETTRIVRVDSYWSQPADLE